VQEGFALLDLSTKDLPRTLERLKAGEIPIDSCSQTMEEGRRTYTQQYVLLKRVRVVSAVIQGPRRSFSSGEASVSIRSDRLHPYYGEVIQGGWVLDALHLDEASPLASQIVCSGPIPSLGVPPFTYYVRGEGEGPLTADPSHDLFGLFTRKMLGSFDYIGLGACIQLWIQAGAFLGRRFGSSIIWSDGLISDIPAPDSGLDGRWALRTDR
jgi:hypothetical protein